MFRYFFATIFRGSSAVLCAVTIPPADLRSLSLYYYIVCGRMCMSSVIQQFLRIIYTMFMISRTGLSRNNKSMHSTHSTNWHSSLTHYETVHNQITSRQEHQTRSGKSGLLQIKCLTFHILDIMNTVKIILRNFCIRDDIHMRPHTA
jgi:hypothetical protein